MMGRADVYDNTFRNFRLMQHIKMTAQRKASLRPRMDWVGSESIFANPKQILETNQERNVFTVLNDHLLRKIP